MQVQPHEADNNHDTHVDRTSNLMPKTDVSFRSASLKRYLSAMSSIVFGPDAVIGSDRC